MQKKFRHGIVGGTFDLLHCGHKKLLTKTFEEAEHVTIGLSLPILYQNKPKASQIESYETREAFLQNYLKDMNWDNRSTIVSLTDFYGTTLTDKDLEAIFVSPETKPNAEIINQEREKKGLAPLSIVVADYAIAEDGEVISSKRIREGLINREGLSYSALLQKNTIYQLPISLRQALQKPHGSVIKGTDSLVLNDELLITVGDVISTSLRDAKILPDISIIDGKTRRRQIDQSTMDKYFSNLSPAFTNQPGTINSAIVPYYLQALQNYSTTQEPQVVLVDGEEDLLALAAILLSPLGSTLLYGLHDTGIVVVQVTEEKKEEIKNFLLEL